MENAKSLARQWIEVWDDGDPTTLPLADDFVHVSPLGTIEGRARYLEIVRPLAEENVASLHVHDVIAEGDRACVSFTMDTPNGPVECCDWVTVADGRIVSVRSYYDPRELPHVEDY
jgi:ketosteroid isomerase-like protein